MTNDGTEEGTNENVPTEEKYLFDLCNLKRSDSGERESRLGQLQTWHSRQPQVLEKLVLQAVDPKSGCHALHWAAGTGFDQAVQFLLDTFDCLNVNQLAVRPSTGRTPLHYAARNGHLSTCQLLIQTYQAHPNQRCHKGSVTPLQLAVWQNQLAVVQYLVSVCHPPVLLERNDFNCGCKSCAHAPAMISEISNIVVGALAFELVQHWIGLVPSHRWKSQDGSGVLPLAKYMHANGLSYASTRDNQQNQGHTPLHKAAWGGNIALMEYFCQEHGVCDNLQDTAGNYAADLAIMGGHAEAHDWLLQFGSRARVESLQDLGFEKATATKEEIHIRYKELAKMYHPDKLMANGNNDDEMFVKIKAAFEHLIHQDGRGFQRNPKHQAFRMLTNVTKSNNNDIKTKVKGKRQSDHSDDVNRDTTTTTMVGDHDGEDDDMLFRARILAVISDYGDKGFPISNIARRWNQIWPEQPFPSPEDYIIQVPSVVKKDGDNGAVQLETVVIPKRVRLLKFLKWKCGKVVFFRKLEGVELAFQKNCLPEQYKALTTPILSAGHG